MKIENMTLEDCNFVFGILMDSKEQEKLINEESEQKKYALDYVFDSQLRDLLEKKYEALLLEKSLKINNVNVSLSKI